MYREDNVLAFLPDNGFEQALLAIEPRVNRRLRASDNADDLVDRDVVVSLLQEQRPGQSNEGLNSVAPAAAPDGAGR